MTLVLVITRWSRDIFAIRLYLSHPSSFSYWGRGSTSQTSPCPTVAFSLHFFFPQRGISLLTSVMVSIHGSCSHVLRHHPLILWFSALVLCVLNRIVTSGVRANIWCQATTNPIRKCPVWRYLVIFCCIMLMLLLPLLACYMVIDVATGGITTGLARP